MKHNEHIRRLFEACRHLISVDGAAQVQHYIEHGEHEMAFEGLVLELIAADATPPDFRFDEWEVLARQMGLVQDPVFDGDFWSKFVKWGNSIPSSYAHAE